MEQWKGGGECVTGEGRWGVCDRGKGGWEYGTGEGRWAVWDRGKRWGVWDGGGGGKAEIVGQAGLF